MTDDPANPDVDIEKTDELPVLSEEAIVQVKRDYPHLVDVIEEGEQRVDDSETVEMPLQSPPSPEAGHAARTTSESETIQRLERELADLHARWGGVEGLLSANSTALSMLRDELTSSREELRENRAQQRDLVARLAGQRASSDEITNRLSDQQSRRQELEEKLDLAQDRLTAMQRSLEESESHNSNIARELEREKAAAASIEADRRQALQTADALALELEAARKQIEILDAEVEQAASRAVKSDAGTLDAQTQLEKLRQKLAESEADRSALKQQLETLRASTATNVSDMTIELTERIASLESYIAGRNDHWKEMESLVNDRGERIAELERELAYRLERQNQLEVAARSEQAIAADQRELAARLSEQLADKERELVGLEPASEPAPDSVPDNSTEMLLVRLQVELAEKSRELEERDDALRAAEAAQVELRAALAAADRDLDTIRDDFYKLTEKVESEPPAVRRDRAAGAAANDASPESAGTARSQAALVCLTGEQPERFELDKAALRIGRGADCDIRILTHFISREHALLTREGKSFVIEDLGSTNGVFVNAVRIDRKRLEHGDWITVGETQFRYLDADS